MNIDTMFGCIDAYKANFCEAEQGKSFIRFYDNNLPDMYDHNFLLLSSGLNLDTCETITKESGFHRCICNREVWIHSFVTMQTNLSEELIY